MNPQPGARQAAAIDRREPNGPYEMHVLIATDGTHRISQGFALVTSLAMLLFCVGLAHGEPPPAFPALTNNWCGNAETLEQVIAHTQQEDQRLSDEIDALSKELEELGGRRQEQTEKLWGEYQAVRDALRRTRTGQGNEVDLAKYDPLLMEVAALAEWQKTQFERSRDVCNDIAETTLGNILEGQWSSLIAQNKLQKAQRQYREMVDRNRRENHLRDQGRITRLKSYVHSAQDQANHLMSKAADLDKSLATWKESQKRQPGDPGYQQSTQNFIDHTTVERDKVTGEMRTLVSHVETCEEIIGLLESHRSGAGAMNPNSALYSDLRTRLRQLHSAFLDEYDPFMDPAPGSAEWKKRRDNPRYAQQQDFVRQQQHARAVAAEAMLGMDPDILTGYDVAAVERETIGGIGKVEHYRRLAAMYDRMATDVELGVKNNLLVLTGVSRDKITDLERQRHRLRGLQAEIKEVQGRLGVYRDICREACENQGRFAKGKPFRWDRIMVNSASGAKLTRGKFEFRVGGHQMVTAVSGKWEEKIDQFDPPHEYGTFEVPSAGKLQAHLKVSPPAKNVWSLSNADTQLLVQFQPKIGDDYGPAMTVVSVGGRIGREPKAEHEGEGTWPCQGRLIVTCGAAGGSGPLTGGQFDQQYSGSVEILETYATTDLVPPYTVSDGDRLVTDPQGQMWLATPLSRIWAGPNTDLTFKLAADDQARNRWDVQGGKIRVTSRHEEKPDPTKRGFYEPGFDFTLSLRGKEEQPAESKFNYVVHPVGTDFELEHRGESALIRVYSGSVEISGSGQHKLSAGEEIVLPAGEPVAFDTSIDPGLLYAGVPALEIPVFQTVDQPDGTWKGRFDGETWGDGWLWQDPDQDVQVESLAEGVATITVPNGNEFWQNTSTAPRLLHPVTGDFQLDAELEVHCEGLNFAIAEFLLYSPTSLQGWHAEQMASGPTADYRLLGGGWMQSNNDKRLPLFGRTLDKSAKAPDNGRIFMRLTREGNVWQTSWSEDGRHWNLAGREVFDTHPMVWAGLTLKRVANDGLVNEPLVCKLHRLELRSGSVPGVSPWLPVAYSGTIEPKEDEVALSLDGSELGEALAYYRQPLVGNTEVVVCYDIGTWNHQPGQARAFSIGLDAMDQSNQAYVGFFRNDGKVGPMVRSDLMVNRGWNNFRERAVDPFPDQGWLRLIRRGPAIETSLWREGQWEPVGSYEQAFDQPVYLYAFIGNNAQATVSTELHATVRIERICDGLSATAAPEFVPDSPDVFIETEEAKPIKAPQDIAVRQWRSPFPIGGLFTDSQGNAYVFSATRDRSKLVQVAPSGPSSLVLEAPVLAGLNRKAGMFDPNGMLMVSVDFWPEGGNLFGGVYPASDNEEPQLWNEKVNFGDITDLCWIEEFGWLLTDTNRRNVFRVASNKDEPVPLIQDGPPPIVPMEMAWDAESQTLFVLDQKSMPPTAELGSTILAIRESRSEVLFETGKGRWLKSIAFSSGGTFPRGLYALDSEGHFTAILGSQELGILSGLTHLERIKFAPTGQLWLTGGQEQPTIAYLENPLVAFRESSEDTMGISVSPPITNSGKSIESSRLGLTVTEVNSQIARDLGVSSAGGAVVSVVLQNGPAEVAGLKPGDVIFRIDDARVTQSSDLLSWLKAHPGGKEVLVKFQRTGQLMSAVIEPNAVGTGSDSLPPSAPGMTAPNPPTDVQPPQQPAPPIPVGPPAPRAVPLIGLRATSAGTPEAHRLNVESPTGAVVTVVHAGGPAQRAGLRIGDHIVQFRGVEVLTYEDFEASFLSCQPGERVEVIFVRGMQRLRATIALGHNPQGDSLYQTYSHAKEGFQLRIPISWKPPVVMANGVATIVSFNGNYTLHCLADPPLPADRVPLDEFIRRHQMVHPEAKSGRWKTGDAEFAFISVPSEGPQRFLRYAIAVKRQGQVVQLEAHAPILSAPDQVPVAIRHVVESLVFVGNRP
ncbi:hypothetical protein C5Y96_20405 [Blastopirellula marina]|uniref:PDZ domain-containing protein n=1 Tax=Blastopirellula marina TaxID=124 RepID=A0A2S8F2K1_9BACT|nr:MULTISPECIES: PDZ domain-containing protein [Pirellulaceae]PQO26396.1 hypothetical protein C5Y96_20405 [Blastopirellula marina]RCS44852.1 PDZ domain-containing protein [Bremerella cremea]